VINSGERKRCKQSETGTGDKEKEIEKENQSLYHYYPLKIIETSYDTA
jgi:hypothetical protein